ncbi:MAG TPA: hypothetical protein VJJ83_04665 [Candidatus Babeliales bacterium]|nr:hypothetical protein [Candidatus Babeliales bacterium]
MAWWQPRNQLVILTSTAEQLICAHFTGQYPQLKLQYYQKVALSTGTLHGLLLCNPTHWRQVLQQLLATANLQLLPTSLILAHEQIVETVTEQRLDYQLLQITGFGPVAEQAPYRAGILAGVLLQYQLVFAAAHLTLLGITTKNGALLGLTALPQFSWTGNLPELVRCNAPLAASATDSSQLFSNHSQQPLTALAYQELLPSVGLYQYWSQHEAD